MDGFAVKLIRLAHAPSTHNNMQSHLRVFVEFCHNLYLRPFPVHVQTILRYIAFLSATGRSYDTVQNHIATVPLKSKLPPLVSFLARRESRL